MKNEIKAAIITPHGWGTIKLRDDLETYQCLVGGLIEAIDFQSYKYHGFINDSGKLLDLPANSQATEMWKDSLSWPKELPFPEYIAGNMIVLGSGNTGKNLDIPTAAIGLCGRHSPAEG